MMHIREIRGNDPKCKILKKLGEGAFGKVYKVKWKSNGKVGLLCSSSTFLLTSPGSRKEDLIHMIAKRGR
jgi:serine/threonine protein kinase